MKRFSVPASFTSAVFIDAPQAALSASANNTTQDTITAGVPDIIAVIPAGSKSKTANLITVTAPGKNPKTAFDPAAAQSGSAACKSNP